MNPIDDIFGWLENFFKSFRSTDFAKSVASPGPKIAMPNLGDYLASNLPSRLAQFSDAFAQAANARATLGMSPQDFALLHAGVIDRESFYAGGGWALRPRGPDGTGDPSPRWYDEEAIPNWASELGLLTGNVRMDDEGNSQVEVRPPAFAGASVPGWGYGLGQIDFVSWKDWLAANNWKDPYVNLDKSAEILAKALDDTGSVRYGVAGYNANLANVLSAKRRNLDPDIYTTGKNYSKDVIARAVNFGFYSAETT